MSSAWANWQFDHYSGPPGAMSYLANWLLTVDSLVIGSALSSNHLHPTVPSYMYACIQIMHNTHAAMFPGSLSLVRLLRAPTSAKGLVGKEPTSVSWLPDWEQGLPWWQRYALGVVPL